MRSTHILSAALVLAACATADVVERDDGTHWISASAINLPWAHAELTDQANALCPGGYETLDERSSWGWMYDIERHIRCR